MTSSALLACGRRYGYFWLMIIQCRGIFIISVDLFKIAIIMTPCIDPREMDESLRYTCPIIVAKTRGGEYHQILVEPAYIEHLQEFRKLTTSFLRRNLNIRNANMKEKDL